MLTFYLSTVVIWMIVIYSISKIFKPQIVENGWVDGNKSKGNLIVNLFTLAAVPFLRLVGGILIIAMAGVTKQQFEEWRKSLNE